MKLLHKPSLEAFIQTCTPLAIIPTLEAEMQHRVANIASSLLTYQPNDDPVSNLARFFQSDRDFLGIALSLTNLSQEKFLRILSAERFAHSDFGTEWGINKVHDKIRHETGFAERIAQLFIDGRTNSLLADQVAAFYLDQIVLPTNWEQLIRSADFVQNVIRRKLAGEYTDKKGDTIEAIIRQYLDEISEKYGVPHKKGQIRLVQTEVDHALPSLDDPYVLIMTSYLETTSSGQTQRANSQSSMYTRVQEENRRYAEDRAFVNFVDGGGWLARRTDLRKLHAGCDYIINLKTLDRLEAIICKHIPARYFTKQPRPIVEG